MRKFLLSLLTISAVIVVVVAATTAFFSDTETSSGNTFTAGAIDLKVDNSSWYNGVFQQGMSWEYDDLTGHLFFNYEDLKPGDWGEDTISLHVFDNDAWVCTDLWLTKNDDMSSAEPELEDGDDEENPQDIWDGELAQNVNFVFWLDDGDNVYETEERILTQGPAFEAFNGLQFALADSEHNRLGQSPLIGSSDYYIGKYWCYGDLTPAPVTQNQGENPSVATGFECSGAGLNNLTQTDNMMGQIRFYAEQSRNNAEFLCSNWRPEPPGVMQILGLENKDGGWNIIDDDTYGTLVHSASPTFYGTVVAQGLEPDSRYQITLNGPGNSSCGFTDTSLGEFGANLFQSGFWPSGSPNLAATCSGNDAGVYNMNLISDEYTVMTDAQGKFNYAFNLALPSGAYTGVKVLVKKTLEPFVSPWTDPATVHTTNLFETAPISFTVD